MSILAWIVLGLVAGWLAGVIMHGSGYGLIGDIVLGILGAFVGGWAWGLLMHEDVMLGFNLPSLLIAVLGAIVLIAISRLFSGRRVNWMCPRCSALCSTACRTQARTVIGSSPIDPVNCAGGTAMRAQASGGMVDSTSRTAVIQRV